MNDMSGAEKLRELEARLQRIADGALEHLSDARCVLEAIALIRKQEEELAEARELLRKAWRILDIDAPNDKTTEALFAFLTRTTDKGDGNG